MLQINRHHERAIHRLMRASTLMIKFCITVKDFFKINSFMRKKKFIMYTYFFSNKFTLHTAQVVILFP